MWLRLPPSHPPIWIPQQGGGRRRRPPPLWGGRRPPCHLSRVPVFCRVLCAYVCSLPVHVLYFVAYLPGLGVKAGALSCTCPVDVPVFAGPPARSRSCICPVFVGSPGIVSRSPTMETSTMACHGMCHSMSWHVSWHVS